MHYALTANPTESHQECSVVGILDDMAWPDFLTTLDQANHGVIRRLCTSLRNPGDLIWQADLNTKSLLLVHCGSKKTFDMDTLSKRITDITNHLLKEHKLSALFCMPQLATHTPDEQLQAMLLQVEDTKYQLLEFKSKKNKVHALESLHFFLPGANEKTLSIAESIASGIHLTRTLANFPANICTPTYLSNQAIDLAAQHPSLQTHIFGPDDMKKMGMGALLAVAQGSHEPPQLIDIRYQGADANVPPIVLVGKGITFDSGGLSLKPADVMNEMKYDMAGAASVLGTIKACALLKLPINVIGLLACAENLPSGTAVKPGDIITSMSGQTVEIINTDAEGRLVLADALTYAERFKPTFVIDIATLTGAVIVALGHVRTGLMTHDDALAQLILTAANDSGDKTWRLPLDEAYQEALDSPIADMVNATFDRTAGSITAGCFLSRFTQAYRWAHLDIAGTAWVSGKKRQATGRPVPLLIQLLRHVAHAR